MASAAPAWHLERKYLENSEKPGKKAKISITFCENEKLKNGGAKISENVSHQRHQYQQ
jgi:hypothetical protein